MSISLPCVYTCPVLSKAMCILQLFGHTTQREYSRQAHLHNREVHVPR
jgi:hypothetical protein